MRHMGLEAGDRKELESLIKAAAQDPSVPIGLARKKATSQDDVEDCVYGVVYGMVRGNIIAQFQTRNGSQTDRDEAADILWIRMAKMPRLRESIMQEFELR